MYKNYFTNVPTACQELSSFLLVAGLTTATKEINDGSTVFK